MLLCSDGVLHSEHRNLYDKRIMFIANKKLRSLRSLRHSLVFIANKTPLASLAPSKFVSLLLKTPLASLAPSKLFCVANIFPRWGCAFLAAYIHGSCLLHMQHAMTTHTTLTHGGFLISKYTVVWGPRWYHW